MNIRHQLSLYNLRSLKLRKKSECFSFGRKLVMYERIFFPPPLITSCSFCCILQPTSRCFLYTPPKLFMISAMIHKLVWKSCIISSFAQSHQILTNSPLTTQLCYCNMLNVKHVSLNLLHNTSNKIQQKIQIWKCRCYFLVDVT